MFRRIQQKCPYKPGAFVIGKIKIEVNKEGGQLTRP
jgi:hypothetical protein